MSDIAQHIVKLGREKKRVLVLGHPHADPDAVSSVIALGEILESQGAKITTGIPKNLSKLGKNVLEKIGIEITINPPVDADSIIILDTSSLEQLKEYEEKIKSVNSEVIFIDHHHSDEKTRKKVNKYHINEDTTSTAELILEIAKELNYDFDSRTAQLLLTGIISDTGHLKFANEETFKSIGSLLEDGADYNQALKALKTPEDPSKKVALLKAVERSELHKAHGRWIIFSEVGAYESDAASLFIKIGGDVAAVASENGKEIRISGRARRGLESETHLHLGKLMNKLAEKFDGTGGGHAGAAAMTVKGDLEHVKSETLKELKKMMEPT